MSLAAQQTQAEQAGDSSQFVVFCTSLVIWLSVFATFTLPGRQLQPTAMSLDSVALVKLACRLFSLTVLGWVIFSHLRDRQIRRVVACYAPWILFAAWAVLSTFWSPIKSVTLGQAGGQVTLILLSIAVAISTRVAERNYLFQCTLALTLYCGVYGCGAVLAPGVFDVARGSDKSVVHPTALGASASLGLVIMTGLLLTCRERWTQPLGIIAIPIFLIALLAAHNRLSLGLAVLICPWLVIAKGQSFRLAAAAIVAAIAGVSYLVLDPGLSLMESFLGSSVDFMQRGQSSDELSQLSGRSEMWSKMWQSYLESPIIGHGYFVCSSTGVLYVWFHEQNHTAHNLVLQTLVSTGLIGLALYAVWHLQVVRILVGNLLSKTGSSSMAILAPAVFVWFLIWSLLNVSFVGPIRPESAVYAIVIGLVIGGHFHQSQIGSQSQMTDRQDAGGSE